MNHWGSLFKVSRKVPQLILCSKKYTRSREENPLFGKYLLITNTVTSGLLFSLGDLIQQQLEFIRFGEHGTSYDWERNRSMFLVGLTQGPLAHYFYKYLDIKLPGTALPTVAKKIAIDQSIMSPLCITQFFLMANALDGKTLTDGYLELKKKFTTVYIADCCCWVPTQFINFYLIHPKYRLLYVNIVTMCYNAFLSFVKYSYET